MRIYDVRIYAAPYICNMYMAYPPCHIPTSDTAHMFRNTYLQYIARGGAAQHIPTCVQYHIHRITYPGGVRIIICTLDPHM